jgi:hypothetical protein
VQITTPPPSLPAAAKQVLGDLPSFLFWTTVSQSLESATREAAKCESPPFHAGGRGGGLRTGAAAADSDAAFCSPPHTHTHTASPFVAEALGAGYPRLLRLFADFFNRVSNFTGTTYTQLEQR